MTIKVPKWLYYLMMVTFPVMVATGLATLVADVLGWGNPIFKAGTALVSSVRQVFELPIIFWVYYKFWRHITKDGEDEQGHINSSVQ